MTDILIQKATRDDSKDIWRWRNDPLTRSMFTSTDEVKWEDHCAWFDQKVATNDTYLYIGTLNNGSKVGICRFDINTSNTAATVSINLNPTMRGKNLSRLLLAGAIRVLRAHTLIPLKAAIKKENHASIACFTACGFILGSEDGDYNFYYYNNTA